MKTWRGKASQTQPDQTRPDPANAGQTNWTELNCAFNAAFMPKVKEDQTRPDQTCKHSNHIHAYIKMNYSLFFYFQPHKKYKNSYISVFQASNEEHRFAFEGKQPGSHQFSGNIFFPSHPIPIHPYSIPFVLNRSYSCFLFLLGFSSLVAIVINCNFHNNIIIIIVFSRRKTEKKREVWRLGRPNDDGCCCLVTNDGGGAVCVPTVLLLLSRSSSLHANTLTHTYTHT